MYPSAGINAAAVAVRHPVSLVALFFSYLLLLFLFTDLMHNKNKTQILDYRYSMLLGT